MDTGAAAEQAREADARVHGAIKQVQHSRLGKRIPTRLSNIGIQELLNFNFAIKLCYFAPVHLLIVLANMPTNQWALWFVNLFKNLYIIVAAADLVIEGVIYFMNLKKLLTVACVSSGVKNIIVVAMTFCYITVHGTMVTFLIYLAFVGVLLFIDLLFLYYLSLYFGGEGEDSGAPGLEDSV